MLFSGHAGQGIAVLVLGLISCRISFELIMIAFKNNEYLKKIAEQTQR